MKELHRLLGLLRAVEPDAEPDDASTPQPRLSDLADLLQASRAAGLDVERLVEGLAGPLDRSVELAAYRVVQESLTNAAKHGGHGTLLRIHEVWEPEQLRITARSSRGSLRGTTVPTGGFGLRGLSERVTLVGGRLESGPTADGFVVRAELPRECPT